MTNDLTTRRRLLQAARFLLLCFTLGSLGSAGRGSAQDVLARPAKDITGHRTMSSFYLSLLRAVGDNRETFGEPDRALRDINTAGPLTEILA